MPTRLRLLSKPVLNRCMDTGHSFQGCCVPFRAGSSLAAFQVADVFCRSARCRPSLPRFRPRSVSVWSPFSQPFRCLYSPLVSSLFIPILFSFTYRLISVPLFSSPSFLSLSSIPSHHRSIHVPLHVCPSSFVPFISIPFYLSLSSFLFSPISPRPPHLPLMLALDAASG